MPIGNATGGTQLNKKERIFMSRKNCFCEAESDVVFSKFALSCMQCGMQHVPTSSNMFYMMIRALVESTKTNLSLSHLMQNSVQSCENLWGSEMLLSFTTITATTIPVPLLTATIASN